jgi:predicted dehydrogenase
MPGVSGRPISRRRLLRGATAGALSTLAACATSPPGPRPAHERLRVGVVGTRQHGQALIRGLCLQPQVEIAGLCDVDAMVLRGAAGLARSGGHHPALYGDLRALFDDDSLDAVCIATPDHWHALATVEALSAGLDVYVASPISHGLVEGAVMVDCARAHGRIVQAGLPARSQPGVRLAASLLADGRLGRLFSARAVHSVSGRPIGRSDAPMRRPQHVDLDRWLGPAPDLPLQRRRLHGDWRWDWATGNGELGDGGVHLLDVARLVLGWDGAVEGVWTCGGRFGWDDDGRTPNTLLAALRGGPVPFVYELRSLPSASVGRAQRRTAGPGSPWPTADGPACALLVAGSEGSMVVRPLADLVEVFDTDGRLVRRFGGSDDGLSRGLANFLAVVRSRKTEELHADIEVGRRSAALAHLVHAAYRTGQTVPLCDLLRSVADDGMLVDAVDRMVLHLARSGLAFERLPSSASGWQFLGPQRERFWDHPQADGLRHRDYREPYALPGAAAADR